MVALFAVSFPVLIEGVHRLTGGPLRTKAAETEDGLGGSNMGWVGAGGGRPGLTCRHSTNISKGVRRRGWDIPLEDCTTALGGTESCSLPRDFPWAGHSRRPAEKEQGGHVWLAGFSLPF